jgi:hypothetical protein
VIGSAAWTFRSRIAGQNAAHTGSWTFLLAIQAPAVLKKSRQIGIMADNAEKLISMALDRFGQVTPAEEIRGILWSNLKM